MSFMVGHVTTMIRGSLYISQHLSMYVWSYQSWNMLHTQNTGVIRSLNRSHLQFVFPEADVYIGKYRLRYILFFYRPFPGI